MKRFLFLFTQLLITMLRLNASEPKQFAQFQRSPASLRLLAAHAILPQRSLERLPADLQIFVKTVREKAQRDQFLRAKEIEIDRKQLEELIQPKTPLIAVHLQDSWARKSHLFTKTFLENVLSKSLSTATIEAAEWIFKEFPAIKSDETIYPHLLKAIETKNINTYHFCLEHLSSSFAAEKSDRMLAKSVERNHPELAANILLRFPQTDIYLAFYYAVFDRRETCLPILFKNIDSLFQNKPREKPVIKIIEEMFEPYTHSFLPHSKNTLELLFQQPRIRKHCQGLINRKIRSMLDRMVQCNIAALSSAFGSSENDKEKRSAAEEANECEENRAFLIAFIEEGSKKELQNILDSSLYNCIRDYVKLCNSARKAHLKSVQQLLTFSADVMCMDNNEKIPLQILLENPITQHMIGDGYGGFYIEQENLERMADLLLSKHTENHLTHTDNQGNTVLHEPAAGLLFDTLTSKVVALANQRNAQKETPLQAFVKHNRNLVHNDYKWWWTSVDKARAIFIDTFKRFLEITDHKMVMPQILADPENAPLRPLLMQTYNEWVSKQKAQLNKRLRSAHIISPPILAAAVKIDLKIPKDHYLHARLAIRDKLPKNDFEENISENPSARIEDK